MLKSTHRPVQQLSNPVDSAQPPALPAGWTEHKAPTGHTYYYNAVTSQSTYTRPVEQQQQQQPYLPNQNLYLQAHALQHQPPSDHPLARTQDNRNHRPRHGHETDRPKTAHPIPNCAPWLLVKTRLGRRFVHNPETKESFWRFPKDVIGGVVEYDIQERKSREEPEKGGAENPGTGSHKDPAIVEASVDGEEDATSNTRPRIIPTTGNDDGDAAKQDLESDEYEEVEVTESEFEDDAEGPTKRQRTDAEGGGSPTEQQAALELGEDDMAHQLAAMGESYALDPGEYGDEADMYYDDDENGEWDEDDGTRGIPLTSEERISSFNDLLVDHAINPFTTWDAIIATNENLITDDRYTLLPTTKARKEAFTAWSTARIAAIHAAKAAQETKDPRIAFLSLLARHASPKLFWAEFRRKHRTAPEMQARQLSDRDREKLYREHINRVTKLPPETLKSDLTALLSSIPASRSWCRTTSLDDALPVQLLTDLRYISLKPKVRDAQVALHIVALPAASELAPEEESEEISEAAQRRLDQKKRVQALRERERVVDEEKRRQGRELAEGRQRLRGEEEELERALRVGREGLQSQLQ